MALLLVRYVGEIGIKGHNRAFFVRRLRRNLRAALKEANVPGQVWSEGQRILAEVDDEAREKAIATLQRVFGVASLSLVERVPSDLAAITEASLALVARVGLHPPMSFRVRTRRADKTFPLTSPEIDRAVGAAIYQATGARVDLSEQADLTVGVEVRAEGTLVYGEVIPGPGGMPIGSQGRAFALISGGIDSPVAAWLMLRRGCGIIPIHFAQSAVEKQKALDNCRILDEWAAGWKIKPIVLDHRQVFEPVAERLHQLGYGRWTCVFCKRTMIAKAAELAPQYHAKVVVTGDSLGQVASQTLDNMIAISWGAQIPILRPLISYDKDEIVALGRRIGTFEISTRESASCPFLPDRPITAADLERLREILARME